jgi:hypothetical protein
MIVAASLKGNAGSATALSFLFTASTYSVRQPWRAHRFNRNQFKKTIQWSH